MLTNLLPGLREVRAPLVAGTLILASLFVLFAGRFDDLTDDEEVGSGLARLSDEIGSRGWIVVAGVAAYLGGSIYMMVVDRVNRAAALRRLNSVCDPQYVFGKRAQTTRESMFAPFSRTSIRRLGYLTSTTSEVEWKDASEDYDARVARNVTEDIVVGGGKRLLTANPELYSEYGRLRAEAAFRDSVALPGFLAAFIVVWNLDANTWSQLLLTTIAAALAVVLYIAGRAQAREAYSMHAHAVADGVVSTKHLDARLTTRPEGT